MMIAYTAGVCMAIWIIYGLGVDRGIAYERKRQKIKRKKDGTLKETGDLGVMIMDGRRYIGKFPARVVFPINFRKHDGYEIKKIDMN